jgi:hypothetical protein
MTSGEAHVLYPLVTRLLLTRLPSRSRPSGCSTPHITSQGRASSWGGRLAKGWVTGWGGCGGGRCAYVAGCSITRGAGVPLHQATSSLHLHACCIVFYIMQCFHIRLSMVRSLDCLYFHGAGSWGKASSSWRKASGHQATERANCIGRPKAFT